MLDASGDEIRAYWRAASRMNYPMGPFLQLLALTACRKSEVAGARWREFHPELVRCFVSAMARRPIDWRAVPIEWKVWTIPAERFKSEAEHLVPLTDDALAVLATIPHYKVGDHLFSTTFGARPINGFSKAKARLDARMLLTLKAMARVRGADPAKVEMQPFVLHDVRRTVRTNLSALRVPSEIAELVTRTRKKGVGACLRPAWILIRDARGVGSLGRQDHGHHDACADERRQVSSVSGLGCRTGQTASRSLPQKAASGMPAFSPRWYGTRHERREHLATLFRELECDTLAKRRCALNGLSNLADHFLWQKSLGRGIRPGSGTRVA